MIIFFTNLLKPTRQTLSTLSQTQTRLFTKSKLKTLPKKFERVKDHGLDDCMEIEKRVRKILKFQDIILTQPNKTLPVTRLNLLARRTGFKRDEVGVFILKYPHIFEVYEHPVQRILFCRFTRKAMAQMDRESKALSAQISDAVICLRKLVMMSNTGRIRLEHVRIARRAFGLPDDFETSVILEHPEFFRLIDAGAETRRKYIEGVGKDSSLTVCAIEGAREREYRANGADSDSEENNRFAFLVNYPNGFRMKKFFRSAVLRWQRIPYWSPYEDVSGYDMRSVEAQKRMEKRAVASIHELLSLTVEKRMTLERIAHFRNALDLPNKMKEFLLRHQGIFYISTKGNQGKIHTVFLREAYRRGSLIEPNDLYLARRQLGRLVLMGSKGLDVDDELIGFSRERKRTGFVRGYIDDASRGIDERCEDRGSSFDLSNVDEDNEMSVDGNNDDGDDDVESFVDNDDCDDSDESSVEDDDSEDGDERSLDS